MNFTATPVAGTVGSVLARLNMRRALMGAFVAAMILMLFWPAMSFAQAPPAPVPTAAPSPFTVQADDYFIKYILKGVLGDVINVNAGNAQATLTGAGTLGDVFRVFNLGVAFFGSLIIMFVAVVGILNTGHDGEFLGKRWSSFWVPIRFAGGAALMLPVTSSGYSFVQAMCLWIAGQGIGFADSVWSAVVDRQTRIGSEVVSSIPAPQLVSSIALSEVCTAYANRDATRTADVSYWPIVTFTNPGAATATTDLRTEAGKWTTNTSGAAGMHICGQWSYSYKEDRQDPLDIVRRLIGASYKSEMSRVQGVMQPLAQDFVTKLFPNAWTANTQADLQTASDNLSAAIVAQTAKFKSTVTSAAVAAVAATPMGQTATMSNSMKSMGFASAGAFYMQLAKGQNAVRSGFSTAPQYTEPDLDKLNNGIENFQVMQNYLRPIIAQATTKAAQAVGSAASAASSSAVTVKSVYGNDESKFASKEDNWGWSNRLALNVMQTVIGVGSSNFRMTSAFESPSGNITNAYATSTENYSVIMQLKAKGDAILDIAGVTYIAYTVATTAAAAADGGLPGTVGRLTVGWSAGILELLKTISLMVFSLVLGLVTLGIMLAVIIPLTPFMLWIMGIAGLVVLIIESLIASVIWAVMIMHPSGEGMTSDHSRQGVMILLMLFMRPALMVMGLAAGMFMVDPMIDFVNDMFYFAFRSTQSESFTGLFIVFGIVSVYCTIVLAIVRKSFAMIHVLPDRVLLWIGGGHSQLGESEVADRGEHLAGGAGQRISNIGQMGKSGGGQDQVSKRAFDRARRQSAAKSKSGAK